MDNGRKSEAFLASHGPGGGARAYGCECRACVGADANVLQRQLDEIHHQLDRCGVRARHLTWLGLVIQAVHAALLWHAGNQFQTKGWWALFAVAPSLAGFLCALIAVGSLVSMSTPVLGTVVLKQEKEIERLRTLELHVWLGERVGLFGGLVDRQLARVGRNADTINTAMGFLVAQMLSQAFLATIVSP